ncbi:hypothetical protein ULG90_02170 [Halopseudomonas pachastrellae]|nr:hypothetical protein ULG90_02170 [Halopseudomonas pachastrellae]
MLALNVDIESIGGKGVERIDPPDFALAIGAKTNDEVISHFDVFTKLRVRLIAYPPSPLAVQQPALARE